jgi:hypothetical protein
VVDFRCPQKRCSCGGPLKVKKTQIKRVVSLAGVYIARRIVRNCDHCGRVFEDPALRRWVAHRCNTAWDVLVFVGGRLFEDCRSIGQVRAELLARDVPLSDSQITKLDRKFILYLALAHRRATPRIKQAMARLGGYILNLDAVHQDDAPALMSGIDGLSRLVLANVKVPSEHAEGIIPFLEKIKSHYGDPIACVHDMGTGICKAVAAVFADSHDFICHFYFLRDAGKDLLEPAYRQLRSCLRRHAVSTRLSALARQARQALADRLLTLVDWLPGLLQTLRGENAAGNRLFLHLPRKVLEVAGDPLFEQTVDELRWRCELFDQLRRRMRIAVAGGRDGLNDGGCQSTMSGIRDGVVRFRRRLENDPKLASDPLCNKMAEQIDKYPDKLFADPIQVQTPSGPATVYPQSTNNILEQSFPDCAAITAAAPATTACTARCKTCWPIPRWSKTCPTPTTCSYCSTAGRTLKPCSLIWISPRHPTNWCQALKTIAYCQALKCWPKCQTCQIESLRLQSLHPLG